MKRNLLPIVTVVSVVSCILAGCCLVEVLDLKRQLRDMENNLNNGIFSVERTMSNLSADVDEKLEKQANMLAEAHWEYGEMDFDTEMVMLKCIVTPKEYKPEHTKAVVICNDKEYEMTLENGTYTASVPIPLFEESVVSRVQFKEDDMARTESLEWYISPRYEFLMEVYANYNGSSSTRQNGEVVQWKFDGEVMIQADNRGQDNRTEAIYMLEYVDGKEKKRTEVPMKTVSTLEDGENHMEAEVWKDSSGNSEVPETSFFYYPLKKTFKVPFGSTLDLYIEVVDQNGLHYRVPFEGLRVDKKGNTDSNNDLYWGGEADIYDDDGELLYWRR